ncbi:MAG: ATP-binding protein [Microthrixaceae bacterium]
MVIKRDIEPVVRAAAASFPVVTVTGPRQSGKSTLCRHLFSDRPYVSLEPPDTRSFASEDTRGFLAGYPDGAVIDEVQRVPELASYLQSLVDDDPTPGRWIITGSQNLTLLDSVNQSLAGRTAILNLLPLTRNEIVRFGSATDNLEAALLAGGYPRIYDQGLDPSTWLASYVATYVERDVRTVSNIGDLVAFQRFVELCAGRTGQLLNYSGIAADAGVSQPTAKAWLSVLETSFLAFRLPSHHANIRKRLTKMSKLHFYDSGLVCWLLAIRTPEQLRIHPLRGAIFESWMTSEIAKHRANRGEAAGLSHYRDSGGLEADVVVEGAGSLALVEAKSGRTVTRDALGSLGRVRQLLESDQRSVATSLVYGGDDSMRRSETEVVSWLDLADRSWVLE